VLNPRIILLDPHRQRPGDLQGPLALRMADGPVGEGCLPLLVLIGSRVGELLRKRQVTTLGRSGWSLRLIQQATGIYRDRDTAVGYRMRRRLK
jgi:hypothetical protein